MQAPERGSCGTLFLILYSAHPRAIDSKGNKTLDVDYV
jgi:hypothetical protein